MKTRRIFYEDEYRKEFDACVLSCEQDGDRYRVCLDATAFYPEGGGQPADQGSLGEARVLDVMEVGEEIIHLTDRFLEPGTRVKGRIDWERRFDLMQQHSGEHIVSGMIHNQYGYENVGFHMGEEFITIDLSGLLDENQLAEIEEKVNAYIWTNQSVRVFLPDAETLSVLPYRSKKELSGEVRLVEYPGADLCACCGLHVRRTGEIGLVKLISVHKFRNGVRIEMLSGKRAWDYMNKHVVANSKVAVALSVKPDQTPDSVDRIQTELYETKGALLQAKQLHYDQLAQKSCGQGNVFLMEADLDSVEIRKCTDSILKVCGGICIVLSGDDTKGYQYAIGEKDGNVRELVKQWNQLFQGRGGGKPFFAQGMVKASFREMETYLIEQGFCRL